MNVRHSRNCTCSRIPPFGAVFLLAFALVLPFAGCTTSRVGSPAPDGLVRLKQWQRKTPAGVPIIRVFLRELEGNREVRVSSGKRVLVRQRGNDSISKTFGGGRTISFVRRGDRILVNGRRFSGARGFSVISSEHGNLSTGERTYRGNLRIFLNRPGPANGKGSGLVAINHVPMNQYLWSVIGGELLPDWTNTTINRTQAVAARTYAIAELNRRADRSPERRFDVYNTQESQVYRGVRYERPSTKRGVQDTLGQVLIYETDRLVPAFFSSTCGGHTSRPHPGFSWLEGPAPSPLKGVPCPWDDVSRHHRWTARIPAAVLSRALFPGSMARNISDLRVTARRDDGRAKTVAVHLADGNVKRLTGAKLRRRIADLRSSVESESKRDRWWVRSTKFNVRKRGTATFHFNGAGWGHGVGLCQYGAYGASRKGKSYRDILLHYYPGSRIERLYGTP